MTVTTLLVSHDGARWLPAVLAGLRDQQRPPDQSLAIDTGSSDESTALLVDALGLDHVRQVRGGFPQAVRQVLSEIDTEWVWILHDDAAPAPGALAELLRVAEQQRADVVGAKLREWPDLKRLLEVGVTISASARRETGLERGEYDQGQHDAVREVLAVNTAGMLVRRTLLERLDGFDDELPVFAADLDFGWRAARVGARTVIAPDAIVFHAEASHRDLRDGGRTAHRREREALMYTVLANSRGPSGAWRWLRLLIGSLVRALGLLLARAPRAAADELAAIAAVHGRPGRLRRARAARRDLGDGKVALAPWWLPLRHGLDFVSDVTSAALAQGRDLGERRRGVADDVDDEDGPGDDSGLLVRLLTSPLALSVLAVLVAMLVAARVAFGSLEGGALSPAPGTAGYWWDLLTSGWHPLAQGTDAPAPSYLIPFALLGSLLLDSASAAVSALFVLGVPLAGWGAWRFARRVAVLSSGRTPSAWLVGWAALAWAMVPVASGAWGQGRFGVLAAAVLLPWLAGASLGFLDGEPDRRRRAGWRTGLLLAAVTAFSPGAWVLAVVVVLAVLVILRVIAPSLARTRSVWGPLLVVLVVPPVLLLPGTLGMLGHDIGGLLLEAGRSMPGPDGWDLLTGRLPGPSAPLWIGALLVLAGVAALVPAASRLAVVACWAVVATTAILAAALSRLEVDLPSGATGPGLSFGLLMIHGALITAILIAVQALGSRAAPVTAARRSAARLTPQRALGAAGAVLLALVPLGGLGWWLVAGDDLLQRPASSPVPAYMTQAGDEDPDRGVLVVTGTIETGLDWSVRRGEGPFLGEDEILALTDVDAGLADDVTTLLTTPDDAVTVALPGRGIEHVVLPAPADPALIGLLDGTSGLSRASTSDRATPAWQFETPVADGAVSGESPWWFGWVLTLQVIALLAVIVLCGPTRREQR